MKGSTKKLGRKVLGVVSAAAMAFSSFTSIGAAAADSNIILENQTYNKGFEYITTFMAPEYVGKSAVKLTYEYLQLDADEIYEVGEGDHKEVRDVDYRDTFEFVAFDMDWGGWVSTGVGEAKPMVGTQYTATVSVDTIEASLGEGVDCQGFNITTGKIGDTTVEIIKMEYVDTEQMATGALFQGSWEKGKKDGGFTRVEGDAGISTNQWYISITNLYVKGFRNPTIDVTVDYENAPNAYVQAEIFNGQGENETPIFNYYPFVDKAGTVTYTTPFNDDLTALSLCYDKCVVKTIRIYDNTEGDVSDITDVSGKTAAVIAKDMGIAWNLGNALECVDENGTVNEIAWSNPRATKELIRAVKAQGFNTVRIPVSYLDKINVDNTVDEAYLARVKQVVDCAYDMGMYAVIDMHNDGGHGIPTKWLDITSSNFDSIKTKFAAVWKDIATYFQDYDQRLVFEGYNELMNGNYSASASPTELANVNALAQQFVTEVRSAGGKNTDRVLIVAGYNTNIDETVRGFEKPTDTIADRLMLSVHYYDPYFFTLQENMNTTTWGTEVEMDAMRVQITKISNFACEYGMPVFIGGYGAINKDNTASRAKYCYELNYIAGYCGNVVTAYWDNGVTKLYGSALFDRVTNNVTVAGRTIISSLKYGWAAGIADRD